MTQARYRPTDKTALVTHRGCLDGTGSALMFIWAGGRRENVLFRNPTGCALSPEEAAPYDEVWFADLCPPSLEDPAGGRPFHVFDHHLSNLERHGADVRCTFSMSHSGTSLLADYLGIACDCLCCIESTALISALEAYDLGRFDESAGVRLADIAATYSQDEMLDLLIRLEPYDVLHDQALSERAAAMESVRKLYAAQAAQYARVTEHYGVAIGHLHLDRVRVAVAVSPVYWKNAVAQAILNRADRPDVAVIIDPTTQMVSLRSLSGGPDCSKIASLYGGGGHARAAGFKADGQDLLQALTNEVFG